MRFKSILKQGLLPALLATGLLATSIPAMAAEGAHQPEISPAAAHTIQSDYVYHGHHYRYHYNGKYYDHRAKKSGHWHYY